MNRKKYTYPFVIKAKKVFCKIILPLLTLLTFYVWFTTDPNVYQSRIEYLILVISLPIFPISIFWMLYSLSDISTNEQGLWVEFIRRPLFIPWEKISSIQYKGLPKIGVWLIKTEDHQLTPFHRTYSYFYTGSFQPGFIVHPHMNSEGELIGEIRKRMEKI